MISHYYAVGTGYSILVDYGRINNSAQFLEQHFHVKN